MKPTISIEEFRKMMLEILNEGNSVSPRLKRLSENEKRTLQIISEKPDINHIELAARLGMTDKGSWRLLATLKKHGAIRCVESGKNRYWELVK